MLDLLKSKNLFSDNFVIDYLIDFCSREYPRYLDRFYLSMEMIKSNINFKLFGKRLGKLQFF